MNALKAVWMVTAEIIPGQPIDEHTRVWEYTAKDYDADTAVKKEPEETIFHYMKTQANRYAVELQTPSMNVVKLKFMWV